MKRSRIATVGATCALALGVGASSASAQGPVVTGGLVNVTLTDVVDVNNNQVIAQVPIGVAANVCGVAANVLAQRTSNDSVCDAASTQLPTAFARR